MDVAADAELDGEAPRRVRILAARAIPKRLKRKTRVLRAIVGHFMKHSGPSASAVLARQIAALETRLSNTHSKAVQLPSYR